MLIDSHCHLPFGEKTEKIIERAIKNNVTAMITIGTSISSSKRAIQTAQAYGCVYCSVGVYPHENKSKTIVDLKTTLKQLSTQPKVVGIGECGIDITSWENGRSLQDQIQLFEMQIELACETKKTLIIHNRNGDEQVLKSLYRYKDRLPKIVAHCFDSTLSVAKELIELGGYVSFSGMLTFNSKKELKNVAKNIPIERILLETDSPYIVPKGLDSKTNEPKNVRITAQSLADILDIPIERVEKVTYANTVEAFGIK